jgi:hypothetical protein
MDKYRKQRGNKWMVGRFLKARNEFESHLRQLRSAMDPKFP